MKVFFFKKNLCKLLCKCLFQKIIIWYPDPGLEFAAWKYPSLASKGYFYLLSWFRRGLFWPHAHQNTVGKAHDTTFHLPPAHE